MENKIDVTDTTNKNDNEQVETLYFNICFKCEGRIYCDMKSSLTQSVDKPEKGQRQVYELCVKTTPLFDGSSLCKWCGHYFCAKCTDNYNCIDVESRTCSKCVFIPWYLRVKEVGDRYILLYYDTVLKKHGLTLKLIKDMHDMAQNHDGVISFM